MAKKIYLKEATKVNWHVTTDSDYPGDMNMKLGCLMRIADATEVMAKNHSQLIQEAENNGRWYKQEQLSRIKLSYQVRALKGVITKMKKKLP